MSGYYPNGGSMHHGKVVDPNADQGNDGWVDAAAARSPRSVAKSNVMPPEHEIEAKNDFGNSVMDGRVTQSQLDCGYRDFFMDPMEPMYTGEPQKDITALRKQKLAEKMDFHEVNEGFVERNNYMDRI